MRSSRIAGFYQRALRPRLTRPVWLGRLGRALLDRGTPYAGVAFVGMGVLSMLAGGWLYFRAWSEAQAWSADPAASRAQARAEAPQPVWLEPAAAELGERAARPTPNPLPTPRPTQPPVAAVVATSSPVAAVAEPTVSLTAVPTWAPPVGLEQMAGGAATFTFLDPPEPGAYAVLSVGVRNTAAVDTGPVALSVAAEWFSGFEVVGTVPPVLLDRTEADGQRYFDFAPVAPGEAVELELHVVATNEDLQAPATRVGLIGAGMRSTGQVEMRAPKPRPGPVSRIEAPAIGLRAAAVQTEWEPPKFLAGHVKATAYVSEGNTVLVGHLRGPEGDVFNQIGDLKEGDEVVAGSRGLDYPFVVVETKVLPADDIEPMQPSEQPRLTLMTCTGTWNPLTDEYSHRLWVIAEPPEIAEQTIAARREVEAAATATALVEAEQAAIRAAAATRMALVTPTPEPALVGRLGGTQLELDLGWGHSVGETPGKLAVYRPEGPGKGLEMWVDLTAGPVRRARSVLLRPTEGVSVPFEEAVKLSRPLFPEDTRPRSEAPEGNREVVVERFTSPLLAQRVGAWGATVGSGAPGEFMVVYTRLGDGSISAVLLGLGSDVERLLEMASFSNRP